MSYRVNIGPQNWRPPDCRAWSLHVPWVPGECTAAGVSFPWYSTSQLPLRFALSSCKCTLPRCSNAALRCSANFQPPRGGSSCKTWLERFAVTAWGEQLPSPSEGPLFLGPLAYTALWSVRVSQHLFVWICAQDCMLSSSWPSSSPFSLLSPFRALLNVSQFWVTANPIYFTLFPFPKPVLYSVQNSWGCFWADSHHHHLSGRKLLPVPSTVPGPEERWDNPEANPWSMAQDSPSKGSVLGLIFLSRHDVGWAKPQVRPPPLQAWELLDPNPNFGTRYPSPAVGLAWSYLEETNVRLLFSSRSCNAWWAECLQQVPLAKLGKLSGKTGPSPLCQAACSSEELKFICH